MRRWSYGDSEQTLTLRYVTLASPITRRGQISFGGFGAIGAGFTLLDDAKEVVGRYEAASHSDDPFGNTAGRPSALVAQRRHPSRHNAYVASKVGAFDALG